MKVPICFIILMCNLDTSHNEVFTSTVDMENVFHVEKNLSRLIREYVNNEQIRLQKISQVADDYENHSQKALNDMDTFLANAINAYLLVKKFTVDWDEIINMITDNTGEALLEKMNIDLKALPTDEDLIGARKALLRLQDTYDLTALDIAGSLVKEDQNSPALNAEDCFELGKIAYSRAAYSYTISWMTEALERSKLDPERTVNISALYEYLSYSTFQEGDLQKALDLTKEWLTFEPDNSQALDNELYLESQLDKVEQNVKGDVGAVIEEQPFQDEELSNYRHFNEFSAYKSLCRNEDVRYKYGHKLSCQYKRHHPMFYLSPLKEEIIYFDPWIAQYYDILTNREVKIITDLAKPLLQRSGVFREIREESTEVKHSEHRTSKTAYIADHDNAIKHVSSKVQAITNLSLETAEYFQVVNYGLGGQYEPHYDFAREGEWGSFNHQHGNRIATAMFYLMDVEAGGFTVFPKIGVKVPPIGKSMVLWYNMKQNGELDYKTKHAGCPVLSGIKWIANKWFHERSNEFLRPCALDPKL